MKTHRSLASKVVLVCLGLGFSPVAAAAVSLWSSDPDWNRGKVICDAAGDQIIPQIRALENGRFLVFWEDHRRTGYDDLYAQSFDGDGTEQWTRLLAAADDAKPYQGDVCLTPQGDYLLWRAGADVTNNVPLLGRLDTASGTMDWTTGFNDTALTGTIAAREAVGLAGSGAPYVTWARNRDTARDRPDDSPWMLGIGRVSDLATGSLEVIARYLTGPDSASSTGASSASSSKMVPAEGDSVIVAWADNRGGDSYETLYQRTLCVQKVDGSGRLWSPATGIRLSPPFILDYGSQSSTLSYYLPTYSEDLKKNTRYDFDLIPDGQGGAFLAYAWEAWSGGAGLGEFAYVQRINAEGEVQWAGDGVRARPTAGFDVQAHLQIVPDGAGGVIVAWKNDITGSLHAQRLDGSGNRLWGDDGVAINGSDYVTYDYRITPAGPGRYVVSWLAYNYVPAPETAVKVAAIDNDGNLLWGGEEWNKAVILTGATSHGWDAAHDGAGGVLVVYSAQGDIFGTRVYANGSLFPVPPPDLVVSSLSNPPPSGMPGDTFSVTDTVKNQGPGPADSSTTRYYLSKSGLKDGNALLLTEAGAVPALDAGAASPGGASVTIPFSAALGDYYYLLACADDSLALSEYREDNNCRASAARIHLAPPNLLVTSVTNPPASAAPGQSFSVTDTVKNDLDQARGVTVLYYLSPSKSKDSGALLLTGTRTVALLKPGAKSTGKTTVTVPPGTPLKDYYLIACGGTEDDKCKSSAKIAHVTKPDLIESSLSFPATVVLGGTLSGSDTVRNQGAIAAAASSVLFSVTREGSGTVLYAEARSVPALKANTKSKKTWKTAIPSQIDLGTYTVHACADFENKVDETNESNNCAAAALKVTAPDLAVTSVTPSVATVTKGSGFSVTDAVANRGDASAGASTTRYYLSATADKAGATIIGSRSVPALKAGATSSKTAKIAASAVKKVTAGAYYLLVCADDANKVVESDEENCNSTTRITVQE